MKTHCRCRSCQTRQVLPMHPGEYLEKPKCRACGEQKLRPDKWMNERDTKAMKCGCDGYDFQHHRMGSLKCKFTASGEYRHGLPEDLPGIELDL